MTAIIAHRGASAYLPEHTLPAKALAYWMGADYLEQDLVATRDDRLVVLHDIHVDRVTDVADRYPGRARDDGRYYARDFDLAELRALEVTERLDADGNAVYPGRFPVGAGAGFRIHTLEDELELVRGLNRTTGLGTGIYPEIKRPAWHHDEGIDMAAGLIEILAEFGYTSPDDPVFVQCFDLAETRRIREDLGSRLRLVQLIGDNAWGESDTDYEAVRTPDGLADVAGFADGIGPWVNQLYELEGVDGKPVSTGLVRAAHDAGLLVHPFTFRADDLPAGFATLEQALDYFVAELAIDGLFTDFPDRASQYVRNHA